MRSLWLQKDADTYSESPLGIRVYTSRLLGASSELVLHGGGNTSVKDEFQDKFYIQAD